MTGPRDLLDIEEAAAYLGGVHKSTVYREWRRGHLKIVKVGRSTFIRRSELDRYLVARERSRVA